jgi:PAS domain S-box-containing protein
VRKSPFILPTVWLAVVWTLALGFSVMLGVQQRKKGTLDVAHAQADSYLEQDFILRKWGAARGGIYVPVSEETPPNPLLGYLPDRDIKRPGEADLTLMNPAYMVRQLHELLPGEGGTRTRITSLNPLRPENGPDPWEESALLRLQAGDPEVGEVVALPDGDYLRVMRPIFTGAACLKCHGHQGYQEGDIRGGVAVSIPLDLLQTVAAEANQKQMFSHLVIWLVGLAGIWRGGRLLTRSHSEQAKLAEDLQQALEATDSIMENVPVGITIIGKDKVVRRANRAALEILGKEHEAVVGHVCHQNICPSEEDQCPVLDLHQELDNSTRRAIGPDGGDVPILKTVVPFQLHGEPVLLEVFIDISDQAAKKRELEATVDELQRFNRQAVGRELRMLELKDEVNGLLRELEREPRYVPKETLVPEGRS